MEKSRSYSGLFIIVPEKEDGMDQIKTSIGSIIKENSGNVVKDNLVGKKVLSYPIKGKKEGIYYEVTFTASPEGVPRMMRQFRITEDILRTLIEKGE